MKTHSFSERMAAAWVAAGYGADDIAAFMDATPETVRDWFRKWRAEGVMKPGFMLIEPLPDTHCHRGHRFTAANTIWIRNGWRTCKTCRRESQESWRVRNCG